MPKPSQEWRKALFYEQDVEVLAIALALLAGGDGGVHLPARVLEALACP